MTWVRAHTNIALIKYWGKKDEALKLPYNSSLSMTLAAFYTDTKVEYSAALTEDQFFLDGIEASEQERLRVSAFLDEVRRRYGIKHYARVTSINHVPKAAGLASSASAFAALALASTIDLNLDSEELSRLARQGSGSASRSIYGGFVLWEKGSDDKSSYAYPVKMEAWPDLVMIACLLNENKKAFASSSAMKETVNDSVYYPAWVKQSEKDLDALLKALQDHNIEDLGRIAQGNALRMHASLLAVNKWYFEPETIEIMNRVRSLQKDIPVYFTMDAGPNVKLITTKKYLDTVLEHLNGIKTIVSEQGPGVHIL